MSLLEQVQKKKFDPNETLCGYCDHPVIQDLDSGKWYHSLRDTKDACNFSGKDSTCKCSNANPLGKKVVKEKDPESLMVLSERNVGVPPSKIDPVPESIGSPKPEVHPANFVLNYLVNDRDLSLADTVLVLRLCERQIIDSIMKEEK